MAFYGRHDWLRPRTYRVTITYVVMPSKRSDHDQFVWARKVADSAVAWVLRNRRVVSVVAATYETLEGDPLRVLRSWDITPEIDEEARAT